MLLTIVGKPVVNILKNRVRYLLNSSLLAIEPSSNKSPRNIITSGFKWFTTVL